MIFGKSLRQINFAGCSISQTADSLGRTLDNLGKDIRTVASGVVGVGDSAEIYAIKPVLKSLREVRKYD